MTPAPATRTPSPAFKRTCAHCGDTYLTRSNRSRYCPPPKGCKQAAYRERQEREAAEAAELVEVSQWLDKG